ncbi:MAG: zinc-dependent peptidase [bacterium]|nr:zinc-dependent peptidase [bacterium]
MEFLVSAVLVALLFLVPFYFFYVKPLGIKRRRREIQEQPCPPHWEDALEKHFPQYQKLPIALREDLKNKMKVFLHEKKFHGCQGLEVTETMKILVAAQACLLLLNRETNYFPKLVTVILYPTAYKSGQHGGPVLGESWNSGELVLTWDSSLHGAANMFDGKNVVFHEFAHQLDQEDGMPDGAPILERRSDYMSWARVLGEEYETLIRKSKKHRKTVLRKYGATHPAEFFAVATEAFYEKPRQLNKRHPELYQELKHYYKVDPLEWLN